MRRAMQPAAIGIITRSLQVRQLNIACQQCLIIDVLNTLQTSASALAASKSPSTAGLHRSDSSDGNLTWLASQDSQQSAAPPTKQHKHVSNNNKKKLDTKAQSELRFREEMLTPMEMHPVNNVMHGAGP